MTSISDLFLEFANSYRDLVESSFGYTEETRLLTDKIPESIYRELDINRSQTKIYGSVGNGNWSEIAWVALLDKRITQSTTKGYYVVYLFDSNLEHLFLCLGLGWTQFAEEFGNKEGRNRMLAYRNHYARLLPSTYGFVNGTIDLKASNNLGKGYEVSNLISKKYVVADLEAHTMIADLKDMLKVYEDLKNIVGDNILNLSIEDSELVPENDTLNKELAERTFGVIDERTIEQLLEKTKDKPREVRERMIKQIARNRKFATFIKQKNNYVCELCGREPFIQKNGQPYAEADHIVPIGGETQGLDSPDNLRCLCAQCHAVITHGSEAVIKKLLL